MDEYIDNAALEKLSYRLQLIAGVWLPILKITEAGDTSFIRKLENAMEDNSELKRSIQSNARATQLTFDFDKINM